MMRFGEINGVLKASDPALILGWRETSGDKNLTARTVNLDQGTFEDLRGPCSEVVAKLRRTKGYSEIPYHPHWHVERDRTYSRISLHDIPRRPPADEEGQGSSPARLIEILEKANGQILITQEELNRKRLLFFAICFRQGSKWVGFVRKTDPKRILKRGFIQLTFNPKLKRVRDPDLALEEVIDLIVTKDEVYVLSSQAYEQLLSDVPTASHEIPAYLQSVERALGASLPLSQDARATLESVCANHPDVARRLRDLPDRLKKIERDSGSKLDAASVRKSMRRCKSAISLIEGDELVFDESNINDFFDFIEGRWFIDDLGQKETRRALNYNLRNHH